MSLGGSVSLAYYGWARLALMQRPSRGTAMCSIHHGSRSQGQLRRSYRVQSITFAVSIEWLRSRGTCVLKLSRSGFPSTVRGLAFVSLRALGLGQLSIRYVSLSISAAPCPRPLHYPWRQADHTSMLSIVGDLRQLANHRHHSFTFLSRRILRGLACAQL